MKTIPPHEIDRVWAAADRRQDSEEETLRAAQRMQEQQPFIMVYLLAMDEQLMDESERGALLFFGSIIVEAMSSGGRKLRQVTGEELDAAEEANLKCLENMDEGPEMGLLSATSEWMTSYNQMPLLGALLQALMAGHEEEPDHAPENIGMALLYLKTVIDCLDQ